MFSRVGAIFVVKDAGIGAIIKMMKMLVTAGPTREFLDPVRFLSNRSTGKMGYAVAKAGVRCGCDVHLISGPVALTPPDDVRLTKVVSASDMCAAVLEALAECDVLIMCAAVADWRPRVVADRKLKKESMSATLELERTEDILLAVKDRRRDNQFVVGFAAETDAVVNHASTKRSAKGLDMIVANDISRKDAGFEGDTNVVTLITEDDVQALPLMSKEDVAHVIVDRCIKMHRVTRC